MARVNKRIMVGNLTYRYHKAADRLWEGLEETLTARCLKPPRFVQVSLHFPPKVVL